jgi:hypothetical protein
MSRILGYKIALKGKWIASCHTPEEAYVIFEQLRSQGVRGHLKAFRSVFA